MRKAVVGHMAGCVILLTARPAEAQLPGTCLDAEVGPWYPVEETRGRPDLQAPPPDTYGDSLIYSVPPRMRLTGHQASRPRSAYVVEIPDNSLQTPHSHRTWRVNGDSLVLSFSTGMAGVTVRSVRVDQGWTGTLRTGSDVSGMLRYAREIQLIPTDCESPPPTHASEDSRLPRGVELETGERLQLAILLPSTVRTQERRSGALTVLAQPIGRFVAADSLIVRVNSAGVVTQIELRYPYTFGVDDLIRSFETEFGGGERHPRLTGVSWYNRSTTVHVYPASVEGRRHRVMMIDPRQRRY